MILNYKAFSNLLQFQPQRKRTFKTVVENNQKEPKDTLEEMQDAWIYIDINIDDNGNNDVVVSREDFEKMTAIVLKSIDMVERKRESR